MKSLFKILKFLLNHPIGKKRKFKTLYRFIKWQIISKIIPYPVIYPYINGAKLIVKKSIHSATANMYVGLQEFDDMALTLHLLNKDDLFLDIGANIGIYTILASKIKDAKTYSFEPIKKTAYFLKSNVVLNKIEENVTIYNFALGDKCGEVLFSTDLDSQNHVLEKETKTSYSVKIETLDSIITESPLLIKMDVEGFEYHVLKGSEKILSNNDFKVLIIEMNGSTNRYGVKDNDIHALLTKKGFSVYSYNPFDRKLTKEKTYYTHGNNIYIRDIEFVKNRVQGAEKISIYGVEI